MNTLILGGPGSGKTTLAKKMTHGEHYIVISQNMLGGVFWTSLINQDTKFIIIEEINDPIIVSIFSNIDEIIIRNRLKKDRLIKCPTVIFISNVLKKEQINLCENWLKIIELK